MKRLSGLLLLLTSTSLFADCSGYFPKNKMYIPDSVTDSGLTREQYDGVIDKMNTFFEPIVTAQGAEMVINRAWSRGTVNASTSRKGNVWTFNYYGGLARHKYMTEDAFALVYCHELGHHMGGAPKKLSRGVPYWASTEGQSDYWGTLKCLRRVFAKEDNIAAIQGQEVPEEVNKKCDRQYRDKKTTAMCKRMALAGLVMGKIHADLRNHESFPAFETPDPAIVTRTYSAHPSPQCRLDTHFQGALCELHWRNEVSQNDEIVGACHPIEGFESGIRPACWYKPAIQ